MPNFRLHIPLLSALLVSSMSYAEETKQFFSPPADRAYPTKLLFGEQHIHSALSADAGGGGTKLLLYRFKNTRTCLYSPIWYTPGK